MRPQPKRKAARALELGRGRDVDYAAAFALAVSGDIARSRALADDLAQELSRGYVGAVHVSADASGAVRAERARSGCGDSNAADRVSLSTSRLGGIGFIGFFGALYPIYVRGLAYLAAHQPAEAAAEFQRILDHRSIVLVDPMDAMARLQLARALALSGDTVKAKSAYNDLFALWKNADPDIPVLNEARAEYARLQ